MVVKKENMMVEPREHLTAAKKELQKVESTVA